MIPLLRTTKEWLNFWWLKIPEPRSFSVLYAFAYLGCVLGGILTFFFPPLTLLGSAGPSVMSTLGILLALGGIIAAVGGTREAWRFERIGIYTILMGLWGYYIVVTHTAINSTGFRYTQLTVIYLATLLFMVRLIMIWQYSFKPRVDRPAKQAKLLN